jgi:Tfp pilus assembly protein PilN
VAWLAAGSRARVDSLSRQVTALTADLQRIEMSRQETALTRTRLAALDAFGSQGPRLARVLEALAAATPEEVVITSMIASPATGAWRVTIDGQARAGTPAGAQTLFSDFLRGAAASPWLGEPTQTPVMTVQANEPDAADQGRPRAVRAQAIPEPHWQLGDAGSVAGAHDLRAGSLLTFSVVFEVRK